MNRKVIFILLAALGGSVALIGWQRSAKARAVLEKNLEELGAAVEAAHAERYDLQTETKQLSDSLEIAESQLVSITQQRDDLQQRVKALIDAENQLKRRVNRLAQSIEQLQQRTKATNKERDQLQEQVQTLRESNAELEQTVAGLTQSRRQLQQTMNTIAQSRDRLKERLDEVTKARDELQEQLEGFTQGQTELQNSIRELTKRWATVLGDTTNIRVKIRLLAVPEFVGPAGEPELFKQGTVPKHSQTAGTYPNGRSPSTRHDPPLGP